MSAHPWAMPPSLLKRLALEHPIDGDLSAPDRGLARFRSIALVANISPSLVKCMDLHPLDLFRRGGLFERGLSGPKEERANEYESLRYSSIHSNSFCIIASST